MRALFFSRFLLSRNYKIQIVARVGRKSAAVLSGLMGASYSHFFIGIDLPIFRTFLGDFTPDRLDSRRL